MNNVMEPKRKTLSLKQPADGSVPKKSQRIKAKTVTADYKDSGVVSGPSTKDRVQAAVRRVDEQLAKINVAATGATRELRKFNAAMADASAGEMHYRSFYEHRDSRFKMSKQEKIWGAMACIGAMKRETGRIIQALKQQRRGSHEQQGK